MRFDVPRQKIENELIVIGRARLLLGRRLGNVRFGVGRERDLVAEICFHEFGKLRLEFFRRWKWRVLRHRTRNLASANPGSTECAIPHLASRISPTGNAAVTFDRLKTPD